MSIFSWLFKRPKAVNAEADPGFPKGRRSTLQVSRDKHFLTVESLDFYGLYQLSNQSTGRLGGATQTLRRAEEDIGSRALEPTYWQI